MSDVVREYYNADPAREWTRLETPFGQLEYASTLRLIERYFPPHGAVCDIGGGPGRYTLALLQRGYRTTLVDVSAGSLAWARRQVEQAGLMADGFLCTDARDLSVLTSASFDAALVIGPLYHVIDAGERATILGNLLRILKPGGVALLTYLNTWGIIRSGLTDFAWRFADAPFLRSMLGEQSFRGRELRGFTESYWATPEAALAEVRSAGLDVVAYGCAEGFASGLRPIIERLAAERPEVFANVVAMVAETAELPQYRDTGDHLNVIARRVGQHG